MALHRARVYLAVVACLLGIGGCVENAQGPPSVNSTRLTSRDYVHVVSEVVNGLSGSQFLANRSATSPPMIVTTQKVENLTLDLIPVPEQWMFILNVESDLNASELARRKNLRFQISPELSASLRERPDFKPGVVGSVPPTHVLTAQFMSMV